MQYAGITDLLLFRAATRAHVLALRCDLELRVSAGPTIRCKRAALLSLFKSLCEANATQGNPVDCVKRPKNESTECKTPTIAEDQARALLAAPDASTLRSIRDRAIVATLLYHGLRRAELCALHLVDLQEHRGMRSLRVHGKGRKIRYVPLHLAAVDAIRLCLEAAGNGVETTAPLFQPVSNNTRGASRAITPRGVYQMLAKCVLGIGIEVNGSGPHALRATAVANALEHNADIAKVQQ